MRVEHTKTHGLPTNLADELSSRFEGLTGTKPSSDALAYMVTRYMALRAHQQEDKQCARK